MSDFRADLHCHSNCSDGTDSPIELLHLAKKEGLSGLSITDHDTLAAYTKEFFSEAKKLELEILVGVEFSADHRGHSVHILGYGVDPESEAMQKLQKHHLMRRAKRNQAILDKLAKKGFPIDPLPKEGVVGRPHIAQKMVEKGYVKDISEAFQNYLGDGKSCYIVLDPVSVEKTVAAIHEAGGKAFIAHPHLHSSAKFVKELLKFPFDGLECYYGNFFPHHERRWLQLAESKNLLVSGGSDYHGAIKPRSSLGSSWVDNATFVKIRPHEFY
ncbi:MAG: PHP domain-containing protein [Candidatus Algichlamydia australiensis]|nr:PHP domain-containing protein [Chlamydiales bacterium]